jgi:hypothetical protein
VYDDVKTLSFVGNDEHLVKEAIPVIDHNVRE